MYRTFTILMVFIFVTASNLQAYQSAHVIVISQDEILLGLTKTGKLSTFGGLRDSGEIDPLDTAARETAEEALEVLGDQQTLRRLLQNSQLNIGADSEHPCFTLTRTFNSREVSDSFKKIRFGKIQKLSHCQKEMMDLVAVKIDLIREKILKNEELCFQDNDGHYRPLRKTTAEAIKAMLQNL